MLTHLIMETKCVIKVPGLESQIDIFMSAVHAVDIRRFSVILSVSTPS